MEPIVKVKKLHPDARLPLRATPGAAAADLYAVCGPEGILLPARGGRAIVPTGIVLSDDPVLAARSGVYSQSFNARVREIGRGLATEAIGEEPAR